METAFAIRLFDNFRHLYAIFVRVTQEQKYRDQLLGAYNFLTAAVCTVVEMDKLWARPGSQPLRDLLKDARAAQLQDIASAQEMLRMVTELCHTEGVTLGGSHGGPPCGSRDVRAPASPAAAQRQAAGTPAEASEPGIETESSWSVVTDKTEQPPTAPAEEQRQADEAADEAAEVSSEISSEFHSPSLDDLQNCRESPARLSDASSGVVQMQASGVPQLVASAPPSPPGPHSPLVANVPPPPPAEAQALVLVAARADELATEQLWRASNFVTVLLHQNGLAAAGIPRCTTLRQLLEAAHTHRQHLPLPADLFFNGDIRVALGCPDALHVSVESINCICDPNRDGHNRIDILVYHSCGAVTRYHPGRTAAQSARPHTIPHGSRTYSRAMALGQGIGAALHVHAPGLGGEHVAAAEHDAPPLLVTADDLADINPVDSKLVNAASLTAALARLPPGETNWSRDGFQWWVFMAGRAQNFQTSIREGIIRVTGVRLDDQTSWMRVTTRGSVRVVSIERGRVRVE